MHARTTNYRLPWVTTPVIPMVIIVPRRCETTVPVALRGWSLSIRRAPVVYNDFGIDADKFIAHLKSQLA